jgi:hypothetical protein
MRKARPAAAVAMAALLVLVGCTSSKSSGGGPASTAAATGRVVASPTATTPPLTKAACSLLTAAEITAVARAESGGATLSALKSAGGPIGGRELCSWRFTQKKGTKTTPNVGLNLALTPPVAGVAGVKQCTFTASGVVKGTPVAGVGSWAVADARGACALTARYLLEISYFGLQGGPPTQVVAAMTTLLRTAVTRAGNG